MKKLIIICFCLCAMLVKSQDSTEKTTPCLPINALSNSALPGYCLTLLKLCSEIVTGRNSSIQVDVAINSYNRYDTEKEGYIGEFQYRNYILGRKARRNSYTGNLYVVLM